MCNLFEVSRGTRRGEQVPLGASLFTPNLLQRQESFRTYRGAIEFLTNGRPVSAELDQSSSGNCYCLLFENFGTPRSLNEYCCGAERGCPDIVKGKPLVKAFLGYPDGGEWHLMPGGRNRPDSMQFTSICHSRY